MEQRMVGVNRLKPHIPNEVLRVRSGVKDIIEAMYTSKKRWAGHVSRMTDNRWAKRIIEWYPRMVKTNIGEATTECGETSWYACTVPRGLGQCNNEMNGEIASAASMA
ncbi:unnamed protein product [Gongylonema pulchrum]|uniref:SCP domain-containing protein n=1 Tax=Gongylonema pulchrum TaxID=637853 RepID=A0A183EGS4_9BILA|nr:unnamed protein product [Gongylonema pulchrum]